MKKLVITIQSKFINPRSLCIFDQRRRGHMTYKDIAKCHGITLERARQIYLKIERYYLRGHFHYEDLEE